MGLLIRMPKMKTKLFVSAMAGVAGLAAMSAPTSAEAQDNFCTALNQTEIVYFNFDSANTGGIAQSLSKVTSIARNCDARRIQVVCHTDTSGSAAYNQALSERRADDVANVLVGLGISRSIISTSGKGETENQIDRGDGVKEELNRRCEFFIEANPAVVVSEPTYTTQTYQQPEYTPQTQTITETVRAPDPTPIESTTVTRTVPSVGQPINVPSTSIPSTSIPSASIPSAPAIPTPPSLPPVPTGGGISPTLLLGGLGVGAAIIAIAASDGDDDDDAPVSP